MIDAISGSNGFPPPPPREPQQCLSSEQTSLIEDTLSAYDADNLTTEDAASIVSTFTDAGIAPGAAFATALAEAGFDAREIGELARVGDAKGTQRPPPPPGQEQQGTLNMSSVVDYLDTLFDEKAASRSKETGRQSIYVKLSERFALPEGESFINVKV